MKSFVCPYVEEKLISCGYSIEFSVEKISANAEAFWFYLQCQETYMYKGKYCLAISSPEVALVSANIHINGLKKKFADNIFRILVTENQIINPNFHMFYYVYAVSSFYSTVLKKHIFNKISCKILSL